MISLLLLVKVTIVLALGGAGYLCSRRFTPGTRHALCAITLGMSALVPFTALYSPVRAPRVFLFAANSVNSAAPTNLALSHWLNFLSMAGLCVVLARFTIGSFISLGRHGAALPPATQRGACKFALRPFQPQSYGGGCSLSCSFHARREIGPLNAGASQLLTNWRIWSAGTIGVRCWPLPHSRRYGSGDNRPYASS